MSQNTGLHAMIVCPRLGGSSEVWIDRQTRGLRELVPTVVCWENLQSPDDRPPYAVEALPSPRAGRTGSGRWWNRLRGLSSRNFLAAQDHVKQELIAVMTRTAPRVVLCHFGQTALLVLPVAQSLGIPVVAHFHGLDLSSSLRNKWYRWSLLANLEHFAAIIVVGSQQRDWLIEQGVPPERLHVIPCGAPVEFFTPVDTREPGGIRFVAVSRLVPWKGIDYSLRAFAKVHEKLPDATFSIIGDGPARAELETLATSLGVAGSTIFTGPLTSEQVRSEFERADVFLQHSLNHESGWFEGFGVSVTEAAAMRLPLVVSKCGGIVDQVIDGETGFIVEQRDADAMATAMLKLALDPALRASMGASGRERAIHHFDTRVMIRRLEEVLLTQAHAGAAPAGAARLPDAVPVPGSAPATRSASDA